MPRWKVPKPWMSVEGIQIWVDGVASAAPVAAKVSAIAVRRILEILFIAYSFVIVYLVQCNCLSVLPTSWYLPPPFPVIKNIKKKALFDIQVERGAVACLPR